jgi:GNAT superfamily N-acetyltransferase
LKPDSTIVVRAGARTDVPQIAAWQVAMAMETETMTLDLGVVTLGVNHVMDNPAIGYYLIAEVDRLPVGCCLVLSEWSDWRNGSVLWIHSVYVDVAHRQSKVFSNLYSTLRARVAADPMLRGLRLYVDKTNHKAMKAYQTLGMQNDHYHLFEWMK